MPLSTHKYSRGGVTVVWQPDKCIHSAICARGLSEVFDPRRKPWIDRSKAAIEIIVEQVKKCPGGALSLELAENIKEEI